MNDETWFMSEDYIRKLADRLAGDNQCDRYFARIFGGVNNKSERKRGKPYTDEEREIIISCVRQGIGQGEISKRLPGRSPNAIGNFICRNNLREELEPRAVTANPFAGVADD